MALPGGPALKALLRIEHDAEDPLLASLVQQATAQVRRLVDRPLTTARRTFIDRAETGVAYGVVRRLVVPVAPIALDPAPVVRDADGDVVDAATYTVDADHGFLEARRGEYFPNGPYAIEATVGLGADPEYEESIEPVLAAAILDLAAARYQQRNAAVASESAGGGVSATYVADEIPARVRGLLAPFLPVGVA